MKGLCGNGPWVSAQGVPGPALDQGRCCLLWLLLRLSCNVLGLFSHAQVPLAVMVLLSPTLQADRLYSKNALSWRLVTTTAGYFVYDVYVHRCGPMTSMWIPGNSAVDDAL